MVLFLLGCGFAPPEELGDGLIPLGISTNSPGGLGNSPGDLTSSPGDLTKSPRGNRCGGDGAIRLGE